MTNLDVTARQEPGPAYHRKIVQAVARAAAVAPGLLGRAYRARRDARHLLSLSDHLLKDIGLARCDIGVAVRRGL